MEQGIGPAAFIAEEVVARMMVLVAKREDKAGMKAVLPAVLAGPPPAERAGSQEQLERAIAEATELARMLQARQQHKEDAPAEGGDGAPQSGTKVAFQGRRARG
jgi:hypothetical protein